MPHRWQPQRSEFRVARVEEEFGAEAFSLEELIEESTVRQIASAILRNITIGTVPSAAEH
jgi:hypothetical protein